MTTSTSIIKIVPALLEVQKKLEAVKKTEENPFFKSNYAGLPQVIDACKTLLNDNGIIFLQPISGDSVETVLVHISGEWISSATPIHCKSENDPQALGSAITYARRYGLQSIIGLSAVDDDGELATDHGVKKTFNQSSQNIPDVTPTNLGVCRDCGAENVLNPKTGKFFCKEKCWTKN